MENLLDSFQEIKNQMLSIANEKKKYHRRLIQELLKKHKEGIERGVQNAVIKRSESQSEIIRYRTLVRLKVNTFREGGKR